MDGRVEAIVKRHLELLTWDKDGRARGIIAVNSQARFYTWFEGLASDALWEEYANTDDEQSELNADYNNREAWLKRVRFICDSIYDHFKKDPET